MLFLPPPVDKELLHDVVPTIAVLERKPNRTCSAIPNAIPCAIPTMLFLVLFLPEPVDEELLGDVVPTVRVLESQIELVVPVQHIKASLVPGARALQLSARSVDVYRDVLAELLRNEQTNISNVC